MAVTQFGQGTISLNPPGGVYPSGTLVTFTATPASGWDFSAWGGDLSGASSPIVLTINGNKSVTATFTQRPTYSVTVTQFGQGTISLNPPGGVYSVGTPVEMLATAADGWVFNGYSGAASGTNPRVNFVMNGNKPVTASFRPDPLAHSIPGTAAISEFGTSVAISGTRMVVGSRELGKACVYDLASATPLLPVVTLNKPVPSVNDQFGEKVAIFGTRVVVAAQSNNTGATAAGAVYVYDLGSSTPAVPVIMLSNPTPRTYENFGWSVAVDGTRVVVGSPFDDMAGPNSGSAYVYDLTSATPNVPVATLPNPTPAVSDYFGQSVAISGSRVVVGAYLDDTGASNAGSAYAYDLAGATPAVPVATFNNPTPVANGYFGLSVAISGARIVVGASNNNNGEGRAYVYDLGSATPSVPVVTLNNPTPSSYDYFGYSVAISGSRIVVGADYDDTVAANAGSAYVFDLNGSAPTVPVMTVSDPLALPDDNFGSATAIDGTTIAVGAPHADPSGPSSGAVYTYSILSNDADNDGLSDSWELLYWPTVAGHAANDDSDGDGFTELQELAFSLNPLVPDSGIQPKPVAEGGYLTITLIKQPWVTYEVQSAGTLLPGQPESFSPATTTILMNNSTTLKVRDNFLFGTPPGRFMRVKVLAAP